MRIITNRIRCKKCGDVIESEHRHDFKWCKCNSCAVDGGHEYLKRLFSTTVMEECIEDLSEYKLDCEECIHSCYDCNSERMICLEYDKDCTDETNFKCFVER